MANAFNNDRFLALNFRFLHHFSLQVKCFDRTLFYFGDWRKMILGFFCFLTFLFLLVKRQNIQYRSSKTPKPLNLFFYQVIDTRQIPWEQTKSVTEIIKNLTVYIDWETLPEN